MLCVFSCLPGDEVSDLEICLFQKVELWLECQSMHILQLHCEILFPAVTSQ